MKEYRETLSSDALKDADKKYTDNNIDIRVRITVEFLSQQVRGESSRCRCPT